MFLERERERDRDLLTKWLNTLLCIVVEALAVLSWEILTASHGCKL